MTVGSLCNRNVATINANVGVVDAAVRMRESHVGDLIVTETRGGREFPIGVVTDRDIVIEVIAEKVDPESLTVADIMSTDLVTVQEDNGLEFALREMRRKGLRRLPVIDTKRALVGILTVDDVIEHVSRLTGHIADAIRIEEYTEAKTRP
jgi:predicted transcriptional regulator